MFSNYAKYYVYDQFFELYYNIVESNINFSYMKGSVDRMTERNYTLQVLGKPIEIKLNDTGRGINVLIAGGDSAHIGAVSIALPGEPVVTHEFEGHRDSAVSDRWAAVLCERCASPVVISCGIHYDGITKDQIAAVCSELDSFLGNLEL